MRCGRVVLVAVIAVATGCVNQYRAGRTMMNAGRYDAAVDHYTRAIVEDPMHFPAFFFRGIAYEELHSYDAAYHDYSRAIEISDFGEGYLARAKLSTFRGRHEEALADFERAIERKNAVAMDEMGTLFQVREADAWYGHGLSLLELGEQERAIDSFERTLALEADHALAYRGRGLARLDLGDLEAGCGDLSKSCDMGFVPSCDLLSERCH